MKVLHLLQSPHFSGAENVVCQIIGMFGNEPDIEMAYCSQDGQIRNALAERNIKFFPMSVLCKSEVKRVIKEYKPDIIHAHDMRASFVAARCCGKIPLVSHIHNNAFGSRGLSIKSIAYILAGLKAKHIFWVSTSSFEGYFFKKLFTKKSSVLQNIIDIDALYKKMEMDEKEYNYDIVYVGRLTFQKNPERLIEVIKKICELDTGISVAIVGTGDLEVTAKKLCCENKLDENIDFLGFCPNPLKIMYDSKVMIMTSRWEGTPMCALEAQSLGVPIVSTPVDGLCDIIANGKNGFLSDDNDVLAQKLYEVVTNDSLHQELSKNSKTLMHKLMETKQYQKAIKNIYESV